MYRPENIPELVFEEVTVKAAGQRVPGPKGMVDGALVVEELHMDGATEEKTFAPGYGEFSAGGGGDLEAVALAVPVDAVAGDVATLQVIWDRAGHTAAGAAAERVRAGLTALGKAAGGEDLRAAAAAVPDLRTALEAVAGP